MAVVLAEVPPLYSSTISLLVPSCVRILQLISVKIAVFAGRLQR